MQSDVVIVGAGPAGIAAAVTASARGADVIVLDQGLETGGQIWRHRVGAVVPRTASRWLTRLERAGVRVVHGASVVDARRASARFDVVAEQGGRALRVSAAKLVLATGARELFLPFPGWTMPGVIGVGGAQALLKSGATFDGKRVIVAGTGPLLLPVAASLARARARVTIVAEQASGAAVARFGAGLWRSPALIAQAARYRAQFIGTPYRTGTWVAAAHGADTLTGVTLTDGRRTWQEPVDILCTGYGLVPNVELARWLGCDIQDGAVVVDAAQGTTIPGVYAAGEVTGIGGAPLSLAEGEVAGIAATRRRASLDALMRRRTALRRAAERMRDAFALRDELRTLVSADTIVCRCEDVTYGAVSSASCARQAKLYTRAGMGPCQGRICGPALEFLRGWESDTVRSPIQPTLVAVLCSDAVEFAGSSDASHSSSLSAGAR